MTLYSPDDLLRPDAPGDIGGKAAGLLALHRLGAPVPPWRVLPAGAAVQTPWEQRETADPLAALLSQWQAAGFAGMAVRSSGLAEDGRTESLAGQFNTVFAHRLPELAAACARVRDSGPRGAMALVVQAAVAPEQAGVLFSAHPAEADPELAYCEVVGGHGHGLVSGHAAPTHIWMRLHGHTIEKTEVGEGGPEGLDAALAAELAGWLLRIEEAIAAPVDVEWAHDGKRLWLLQARPITALRLHRRLSPPVCATSWFFDQRFSEPITPMTRSSLVELITRVGVREALAIRGAAVPEPLLHDFGGQAYVAHEAFCRAFGGAPSWLLTQDLRQLFPERCHCAGRGEANTPAYLWMTLRALLANAGDALLNLRRWNAFRAEVMGSPGERLDEEGFDTEAWHREWAALDRLNERFLRLHRWSLLWADYGYRVYGGLKACLPARLAEALDRKLRREMCLPTAEANAALHAWLIHPEDDTLRQRLSVEFGTRSPSLDYASATWSEMLETGALARVYGFFAAAPRPAGASAPPRGMLSFLMKPLRRALEMREEQRFTWERVLARQRALLRQAGRWLVCLERLGGEEEVWFLYWRELQHVLGGADGPSAAVLAQRRHAHWVFSACRRPAFVGPHEEPAAVNAGAIAGTGAAGARVRGVVRLAQHRVPDLRHAEEPVILVMRALDPAGTPVLRQVAGVVLERGGLLSHAAIIARELDVPLVVDVPNALEVLGEGWEVEIDGRTGRIEVLRKSG